MNAEEYTREVLKSYLGLEDTPDRARPADRSLARSFYERGISLAQIRTAVLVASGRRRDRPPEAPKLGRIRSLAYFVPVIEEFEGFEDIEGYLEYLESTAGRR